MPATRTLPIPRPALSALDTLRNCDDPAAKTRLITLLVRTAYTPIAAPADDEPTPAKTTDPLTYIQHRLLAGLSVSARRTRLNFSLALAELARAAPTPSPVCAAAVAHFLDDEYDHDSSASPRERCLGALAAATALTAACAPTLPPGAARDVVRLLRLPAGAEAASWHIGPAAGVAATELLAGASPPTKAGLAKPLWQWAEARPTAEDSFVVATALLRTGLATPTAFRKLYADVAALNKPLTASLSSGFSLLDAAVQHRNGELGKRAADVVPAVWLAALAYCNSSEGPGLLEFWPSLAARILLRSGKSTEKRVVAVGLLPGLLAAVHDVATFNEVFTPNMAREVVDMHAFAGQLASRGRTRAPDANRNAAAAKIILQDLSQFGSAAISDLQGTARKEKVRGALTRAFLLWCVRGGLLTVLFEPGELARVLKACDKDGATELFSAAVREFARPLQNEASQSGKDLKREVETRRANVGRFLFTLGGEHSFLASDVMKLTTAYSVFRPCTDDEKNAQKGKAKGKAKSPKQLIKFDTLHTCEADEFLGVLPSPEPPLSHESALFTFRKLAAFVTENRNETALDSLALQSLNLVLKVIPAKRSGVALRCVKPGDDEALEKIKSFFEGSLLPVVSSLSAKGGNSAGEPLRVSLERVGIIIGLCAFEPVTESENEAGDRKYGRMIDSIESFMTRFVECRDALQNEDKQKNSSADSADEGEGDPEPIERVTHLIADLCGKEFQCFKQFALRGIEPLGNCADDRVVAVLFDALDAYLGGVKDLGNPDGDEEDSEDEVDGEFAGLPDAMKEDSGDDGSDVDDEKDSTDAGDSQEDEGAGSPETSNNEGSGFGSLSGEASDDNDVDINIDDEDPETLAMFDEKLTAHMRLLRKEKKLGSKKRTDNELRDARVTRVLALIENIASTMRRRLEKTQEGEEDTRLPIVFLDLHVRLFEFVLDEGADNLRFLPTVISILKKHMHLPQSVFSEKITDKQSVDEITDRLFFALTNYSLQRAPIFAAMKIFSKSLGFFVGLTGLLRDGDFSRFSDVYVEMVKAMMRPDHLLICADLFASCLPRSPGIAFPLASLIESSMSQEATRVSRARGADMIAYLASLTTQTNGNDEEKKQFWVVVEKLVKEHCAPDRAFKNWNPRGIAKLVEAVVIGDRCEAFSDYDALIEQLKKSLNATKPIASYRNDVVRRMDNSASSKKKRKARQDTTQEEEKKEGNSETQEKTPKSKRKKKGNKPAKVAVLTE